MDNKGWTLFFSYTSQGNNAVIKELEKAETGTDDKLFPQVKAPEDRLETEKIVPFSNGHVKLGTAFNFTSFSTDDFDSQLNKIPTYNKVSKLWFFCSMFEVDKPTGKITPKTMASYTTTSKEVIRTAFTDNRAGISQIWLQESSTLVPKATPSEGDEFDADELPQF